MIGCFLFRISIRIGTHFNDLTEVEQVELNEPSGWMIIPLQDARGVRPIKTFMIQIAVLSNHQNGRDTHLRLIKIHAPVQDGNKRPTFTSTETSQFSTIR